VLDSAIDSGVQQRGSIGVVPPDQVRGSTVVTANLLHLAHAARLADPVTLDDQFVSDIGEHVRTPFEVIEIPVRAFPKFV